MPPSQSPAGSAGLPALALSLTLLAAAAAGCATTAPAPTRSSPETRRATEVPASGLRYEVDVSPASNLFHWLDNLAGSTPGKTRDAYVRTWARYHGILGPEDRELLRRWRALRIRRGPRRVGGVPRSHDAGCLPEDPGLGRRQRMNVAALEAADVDELRASLAPFLAEDEARTLDEAIALFEPRFRRIWQDAEYLDDFARELRAVLETPEPRDVRARMERLFGGEFENRDASRISLMALLAEDRGTHAEANGRHLLLEIRPSDRARDQLQVVFHELAHDLYARLPAARRGEWARWFLRRGPAGALAWNYQHEAIPTALGQGVAEARLAPEIWRPRGPWYHRTSIDLLARAIYPRMERALFEGETMSASLADEIVEVVERELAPTAPLRSYLATVGLAGPRRLLPGLAPLARALPAYRAWEIPLDGGGWERTERFDCLPLVLILDETELAALPPEIAKPPRLGDFAGRLDEIGAVALPAERDSGAIALWILTRDQPAAEALSKQLAAWTGWPTGPVVLRRGAGD